MNMNISDDKRQLYTDVFHMIDTNRDGKISADELRNALSELGCEATLEQATKMVQLVDENNDGMVELEEFVHMAERTAIWSQPNAEEEVLTAFKLFDKDNNGKITAQEVEQAMAKMGQPLTRKEANEMLKTMDKDGDGLISYKEFVASWSQIMGGQ